MKVLSIIFIICSLLYMLYVSVYGIKMYIKFFKYKEVDIFEKNKGKIITHCLIAFIIAMTTVSGLPGYLYHL